MHNTLFRSNHLYSSSLIRKSNFLFKLVTNEIESKLCTDAFLLLSTEYYFTPNRLNVWVLLIYCHESCVLVDESLQKRTHTCTPERERLCDSNKNRGFTINDRQFTAACNIEATLTQNSLNSCDYTGIFKLFACVSAYVSFHLICTCVFTHVSIIANARTHKYTQRCEYFIC